MDLIHKYRKSAYNQNFKCDHMWLNIDKNRKEIIEFFAEHQKNNNMKYRFSIGDIDDVFRDKNFNSVGDLPLSRIVIQKANFNVQQSTKDNGCTTRLLFLVKDLSDNSWFIYGYAKGRFNSWDNFEIDESGMLGYTFYTSLSERHVEFSENLSDNHSDIERLRARLKNRSKTS